MENRSIDGMDLSADEKSRREFMKSAGKFAVYTPPLLMLLMAPRTEAIAASTGRPDTNQPQEFTQNSSSDGNGGNTSGGRHSRFWLWRVLSFWN